MKDFDTLSLYQYRRLCRPLPLPTRIQVIDFVAHVSRAHSWYKHLRQQKVPFHFFLDRSAGYDKVFLPDGTVERQVRTAQGFHHSWIPTSEYRQSFGHLAFSCAQSTGAGDLIQKRGPIYSTDGLPVVWDWPRSRLIRVPTEILQCATAHLNRGFYGGHSKWQFRCALSACETMLEAVKQAPSRRTLAWPWTFRLAPFCPTRLQPPARRLSGLS